MVAIAFEIYVIYSPNVTFMRTVDIYLDLGQDFKFSSGNKGKYISLTYFTATSKIYENGQMLCGHPPNDELIICATTIWILNQ